MMSRIIFMSVLLMLTSCTTLKPVTTPVIAKYSLNQSSQNRIAKKPLVKTLLISIPTASPGYQSDNMLYMKVPFKIEAFARNAWVAPPAQMLQPLLFESFRNSGIFKAVVTTPFTGLIDYRLDTKISKLQQEFIKSHSELRMVMDATLVSAATEKVMSTQRFEIVESVPEKNPYSGVIVANKVTVKMLHAIVQFVEDSLEKH